MLANISHDEMRRLFARIEELMENHKSIDIEASLMACELLNSSLILPAQIGDDSLGFLRIPGFDDNYYVVFCTDMNEFEKSMKREKVQYRKKMDKTIEIYR